MSLLSDKIQYFRQHRFVRNVAVLQTGTFIENLIQGLASIFIARLLQPELFGIYTLAFSMAGIASLFLGIGAQDAITTVLGETYTRQDKDKTKEALAFLLKIIVLTGALTFIGSLSAPLIAKHLYGNSAIGLYAIGAILAVIISTSFFSLSTLALQISGRIKKMMALGVADQIIRYALSVGLIFYGFGVLGGVLGHLLGAVAVFFISLLIWEKIRYQDAIFPSLRRLFRQAWQISWRKYLGFSFWIAVDRNVANLYNLLPVILIGIFVSTTKVTFFKLAFAYLNLAMSLLGPVSTLLNVEFPRILVEDQKGLRRNFVRVTLYAIGLSVALTGLALLAAPIFFKIFYGQNFLPSVKYTLGLFLYGALYGLGVGLGPMWRAMNKVKISILINSIVLGLGIPAGIVLLKRFGLWGGVVMVTAWFIISHLISFIYLATHLRNEV